MKKRIDDIKFPFVGKQPEVFRHNELTFRNSVLKGKGVNTREYLRYVTCQVRRVSEKKN